MEGDVSKRTITVLVILTVIISLLGTLSVMSAMADLKEPEFVGPRSDSSQGYVSLRILEPGEEPAKTERLSEAATGYVALEILPPEKPRILLLPE